MYICTQDPFLDNLRLTLLEGFLTSSPQHALSFAWEISVAELQNLRRSRLHRTNRKTVSHMECARDALVENVPQPISCIAALKSVVLGRSSEASASGRCLIGPQ